MVGMELQGRFRLGFLTQVVEKAFFAPRGYMSLLIYLYAVKIDYIMEQLL
jgi:hypothetical protein